MHQPATAALLEPAELKNVCAETAASPVSVTTSRPMQHFLADYRATYGSDPDAFAAAQYDAVQMLGQVLRTLASDRRPATPAAVRHTLATEEYRGIVTNYRSDGKGNMAHEAEIVCFDGTSRVPVLATRYVFPVR
jgi:branched-chain amino acid transport system substrate-binding protein